MSLNYADGLSPYPNKGQLGLQEKFDKAATIALKVEMLAKWINKSKHVAIHTGAGISTAAGIPDFRGPRGVWTLEAKGQKPDLSKDFNEATPTATHMAVARLVESGKVKYVISQNIDGLHLRSGLPRKYLSELHGNMFIEQCNSCNRQFVRNKAVPTVGQKSLNKACPTIKSNGRPCRGRLHDCILDWEHSLPENDLAMADFHSCMADLSIAIGTTMQIVPSGSLPLYTKRAGGKLVIINLQPTKHDKKADLIIHGYADEVMTKLMKQLSLRIPKYAPTNDPTRLSLSSDRYFDWTITDSTTAQMRKVYEAKCGKRLTEVIDEDEVPLGSRLDKTRKRKSDEGGPAKKSKRDHDKDSDLEVVEEIPRRRGRPKKNPELLSPPKLTIKKAPGQKYEIVKAKKQKIDVEIVRETVGELCGDLEMVCESDDDGPLVFTTNFKRYLDDDKTFKREEIVVPALESNEPKHDISSDNENKSDEKIKNIAGESTVVDKEQETPMEVVQEVENKDANETIKNNTETTEVKNEERTASNQEKIAETSMNVDVTQTEEAVTPNELSIATNNKEVGHDAEIEKEVNEFEPASVSEVCESVVQTASTNERLHEEVETGTKDKTQDNDNETASTDDVATTTTDEKPDHDAETATICDRSDDYVEPATVNERRNEGADERPSGDVEIAIVDEGAGEDVGNVDPVNDGNNNRAHGAIENNDPPLRGGDENDLDDMQRENAEEQQDNLLATSIQDMEGENLDSTLQENSTGNCSDNTTLQPCPVSDIDLLTATLPQ